VGLARVFYVSMVASVISHVGYNLQSASHVTYSAMP
jgi:hypothetical protein